MPLCARLWQHGLHPGQQPSLGSSRASAHSHNPGVPSSELADVSPLASAKPRGEVRVRLGSSECGPRPGVCPHTRTPPDARACSRAQVVSVPDDDGRVGILCADFSAAPPEGALSAALLLRVGAAAGVLVDANDGCQRLDASCVLVVGATRSRWLWRHRCGAIPTDTPRKS